MEAIDALFAHAKTHAVIKTEQTVFGTRYVIEGELEIPTDRKTHVRVVWFIDIEQHTACLVTAYPLEDEND